MTISGTLSFTMLSIHTLARRVTMVRIAVRRRFSLSIHTLARRVTYCILDHAYDRVELSIHTLARRVTYAGNTGVTAVYLSIHTLARRVTICNANASRCTANPFNPHSRTESD